MLYGRDDGGHDGLQAVGAVAVLPGRRDQALGVGPPAADRQPGQARQGVAGDHPGSLRVVDQLPQPSLGRVPVAPQRQQAVAVGVAGPVVGREVALAAVDVPVREVTFQLGVAAPPPQHTDQVHVPDHDGLVVATGPSARDPGEQVVPAAVVAALHPRPPAVHQARGPPGRAADPLPHRHRGLDPVAALRLAIDVDQEHP